jgi:hypothetical protein
MRPALVVFGILFAIAGTVWLLQGIGVLQGSFMSNNSTWVWLGGITAFSGIGILLLGLRAPSVARKT